MSALDLNIGAGTGANSRATNALRGMHGSARDAASRQAIEGERVAWHRPEENSIDNRTFVGAGSCKPCAGNDMPASTARAANPLPAKLLAASRLRGFVRVAGGENATEIRKNSPRTSTLVRWCKFNFVGAVGIFVQFGALFFFKSVLHFNYLAATALAVEVAVVHNFFWHQQFTWAERVQPSWEKSLPRFLRFNFTTGLISIAGNLGIMRVMVGWGHWNYLAANGIAIVVCSVLNFVVSDGWVFGESKTSSPRINADSRGFKSQDKPRILSG